MWDRTSSQKECNSWIMKALLYLNSFAACFWPFCNEAYQHRESEMGLNYTSAFCQTRSPGLPSRLNLRPKKWILCIHAITGTCQHVTDSLCSHLLFSHYTAILFILIIPPGIYKGIWWQWNRPTSCWFIFYSLIDEFACFCLLLLRGTNLGADCWSHQYQIF